MNQRNEVQHVYKSRIHTKLFASLSQKILVSKAAGAHIPMKYHFIDNNLKISKVAIIYWSFTYEVEV